ncbi:MAG: CHAD domain-containing protein, partial [Myxococcota bacterium]|nr:CHAD domain-containing protein [Myxococcota bacterium]
MSDSKPSAAPLLECAPEEGARRLALRWIDEATEAAERVVEGNDDEALHDLRVALRKLRTVVRTYDGELRGALAKKRKKKLDRLVQATGAARDAEVQITWLEEARGDLEGGAQPGIDWLLERLREREEAAYAELRATTAPALLRFLPKVRRELARYSTEHVVFETRAPRRFADTTAKLVRKQAEELASVLRGVRSPDDEERAHEARKDGKRLRYLLEPLRHEEVAGASEIVKTLKRLQDLLGELNDIAMRSQLLREEIERAALERARSLAERAQAE